MKASANVPLSLLEGALARVVRVPSLREACVLRGGLMVRRWSGPVLRPVDDLDFLWTESYAPEPVATGLLGALAADLGDGLAFDVEAARREIIWAETAHPGLRLHVPVRGADSTTGLQIDVGSDDPLDPPAVECELPSALGPLRVRTVRPETMLAWKVHGLFERGRGRWRPKDLWDVDVLSRHAPREEAAFERALKLAFESRGMSLSEAMRLVEGAFGTSRQSRRKWERFREERGETQVPDLPEALCRVATFLRPYIVSSSR